MAKKKKEEIQDETSLDSTNSTQSEETKGDDNKPVINKKFAKLADYKKKINFQEVKYKPQEWINMSDAFKSVCNLPGIPVGHISMVFGKSDTGKSTMAMELGAYAQKQGILPVFIITENKFSEERAEKMGIDWDSALLFKGVRTIEEGGRLVKQILDDQEKGNLKHDVVFIWDSIGATPTEAELINREDEESGGAMMLAARVIKEQFQRYLAYRINGTRLENFPYTATLFVVNQGYLSPPNIQMGKRNTTIEPYGGEGMYLACTLVFRMGGVMTRSSKVDVKKKVNGVETSVKFAIKSAIEVQKNHITDVSTKGTLVCTDTGFILDDKDVIDNYRKEVAPEWNLEYDKYWDNVSLE